VFSSNVEIIFQASQKVNLIGILEKSVSLKEKSSLKE